MNKTDLKIAGLLWVLTAVMLGGCGTQDSAVTATPAPPSTAVITSGSYQRINIPEAQPEPIALGIIQVEIDRENGQAIFEMADGSRVHAAFRDGNASTWGQGCPTNFGATHMEILSFEAGELTLDGVSFEQPLLIATCPSPPTVFVLRETSAGFADYLPAVACNWWEGEKCIYFGLYSFTLRGQIVDTATNEGVPQAKITFSSPAGEHTFTGSYHLDLPGGALLDFSIRAPGYQDASGQVETTDDMVIFRFDPTSNSEALVKAYTVDDPTKPFTWDFSLVPESTPTPLPEKPKAVTHSKPRFQVFILNPVTTCIAGNDFASGTVCRGQGCGDRICTWEQFDPTAPLVGIPLSRINDPQYADLAHR